MTPLRLLIADDHELAREGVRALLERTGQVTVVAEVGTAEAAVQMAIDAAPDIALLDIRFAPGAMDGLEAARRIAAEAPAVRVILLTLHEEAEYVRAALAAGARGFVPKDATCETLVAAIAQVADGGLAVPPALVRRALDAREAPRPPRTALDRLTPREREVLDALAAGRTNKEIASILGISPGTVKAHVERVIGKLGVRDRTQAAVLSVAMRT